MITERNLLGRLEKGGLTTSSKLVRVSPEELETLYYEIDPEYKGGRVRGFTYGFEGRQVAVVPRGANSNVILHELSHAELGHEGVRSPTQEVSHEIEATSRGYGLKGKSIPQNKLLLIGCRLIDHWGISAATSFSLVEKELKRQDIKLSRESRSELWSYLKAYQDS